jgi:ABC-type transport system involved in multi-copper enzyme maturation permease subunit
MSKAITEQPHDPAAAPPPWQTAQEIAPSVLREEEPWLARQFALVGLLLFLVGLFSIFLNASGYLQTWLSRMGVDTLCLVAGVAALLFHASAEKELQLRRLYWIVGWLWLAAGVVMCLLALREAGRGWFLPGGASLAVALGFLVSFIRNEREAQPRDLTLLLVGAAGAVLALAGFAGGAVWRDFLLPYGALFALLGLVYLGAFVAIRGIGDDVGYQAGLGIGLLGLLVFFLAFVRAALFPMFFSAASKPAPFLVPYGLVFMGLGLLYAAVSAGLCSDNTFITLTRRELLAFFYSPVAYFVLIAMTVVAWIYFFFFLIRSAQGGGELFSPMVVSAYVFDWGSIFCLVLIVPLLTMRLLSEERRSGTLEVLLTAPVNETTIVLSKFTAALIFFLMTWLPWPLFLLALRIENGQPFDGSPLISFLIAQALLGAAYLSMGLFFSSLTGNQIVSAILTAVGMIFWVVLALAQWVIGRRSTGAGWATALDHVSFVRLWDDSLRGAISPRSVLFFLSVTVFFLFLTVKVLESRKWR